MDRTNYPTMAEIAAATGATVSGVALALSGDARQDPGLRARISETAHEAGFTALASVQERLGRPLRVVLLFKTFLRDDPEANRFYAPISSAITIACSKTGVQVDHAMMRVDAQYRLLDVPAPLASDRYDGAFLFGAQLDTAAVERVRANGCPIILVDGYSEADACDSVWTDNAHGAALLVERLLAAGHRDIALLGSEPVCYPSVQERRRGYSETIRAHGLEEHFIDVSYVLTAAGAVLGVDYVRRHPEVTAVFGANDLITAAFMEQARDAGLRLPSDLSTVGFDDIDLAGLIMPALTTMGVDKTQMARAAIALMAYRLEQPQGEPLQSVVCPQLVERESIAPPRPR
jgi:DNA-binding LacI/PurR family transcriptional regulator